MSDRQFQPAATSSDVHPRLTIDSWPSTFDVAVPESGFLLIRHMNTQWLGHLFGQIRYLNASLSSHWQLSRKYKNQVIDKE